MLTNPSSHKTKHRNCSDLELYRGEGFETGTQNLFKCLDHMIERNSGSGLTQ